MISVIIAAYKEETTIGRAISSFLNQEVDEEMEVLVICPDEGTTKVVKKFSRFHIQWSIAGSRM